MYERTHYHITTPDTDRLSGRILRRAAMDSYYSAVGGLVVGALHNLVAGLHNLSIGYRSHDCLRILDVDRLSTASASRGVASHHWGAFALRRRLVIEEDHSTVMETCANSLSKVEAGRQLGRAFPSLTSMIRHHRRCRGP